MTTPPRTIAEDLLLLLLDPRHGTVAGEGLPLLHVLAGGVLVELALHEDVTIDDRTTWSGRRVRATGTEPPPDPLLRATWDRLADRPTDVHQLIAETGPRLRAPVLDRLVERGDLVRERRRLLGVLPSITLRLGGTGRRDAVLGPVRAALVDGAAPDPRTAALAGLLSASGSLPQLHREIPWSGAVHDRGKQLERGEWGTEAAAEAVRRTVAALVAGSVVAGAVVATLP
jgi:hypothetical protein